MKIRFVYSEFENWGEAPRQRIPLVDGVVALIGENGSGKSTFVDGLKLLLGNATLEDNRTPDDYVPEGVGHAYVLAGADNRPGAGGSRPWDDFGYRSDVVSLCCFLQLGTSGKWEKTYYIVDGPFHPQREREEKAPFTATDYQKVMETMGCTRTFYRLMALDPDKVKSIIKQKPRDLFRDVLNITGDRTLADNLAKHRAELKQTQDRLTDVSRKLYDKRREVSDLLQQKREVEEYEAHLAEATRFDEVLRKYTLQQTTAKREACEKERAGVAELLRTAGELVTKREYEENEAQHGDKAAQAEVDLQEAALSQCIEEHVGAEREAATRRGRLQGYEADIQRAADITETEDELSAQARLAEDEAANHRQRAGELLRARSEATEQLKEARAGRDYPVWVSEFLERCGAQGIHPTVVADAIEFRDPSWQRAIESILGQDRFCLVVDEDELDTMFDLVDSARYRAWVDAGHRGGLPAPRPGSALAQVVVTNPGVYKFVRILERYELAANKEEAKRIRARGGWAVTPSATVWTDRGIRNIDCGALYCGKETRRQRIAALEATIAEQQAAHRDATAAAVAAGQRAQRLRTALSTLQAAMRARENLPPLQDELRAREFSARELAEQREALANQVKAARQRANEATSRLTEATAAKENARSVYQGHNSRWVDLGNTLVSLEKTVADAQERLAELVSDRDAWAFVAEDISAFLDSHPDHPEGPEVEHWLKANHDLHRGAVLAFETNRKPKIDFLMLRGLEGKQKQLESLEDEYKRVGFEVEKLTTLLEATKHQHRVSVRRTMNRYLDELEKMARLIPGTTTEGSRLAEIGEDDWELQLKVAFDGKQPVDYFSRKLSGGQKAAMSVMLLMAALKLDGTFSLMFLDEPAARLDDKRTKELGQLLRAAGAQIFLTVPTSASLLAMDWIDHVLITTKKVPDERHAPPIKVRLLRGPRGESHAQNAL